MKINLSICDRCKKVIGEKQQIIPMTVKVGDASFEHELCKKCADSTKVEIKKLFGNVKLDYSAIIKTEDGVEATTEEIMQAGVEQNTKTEIVKPTETTKPIVVAELPNVQIDATQKGPLTLEQKKIAEAGYKAGLSLSDIAAKVGRKEETCKKYIDKMFGGNSVEAVPTQAVNTEIVQETIVEDNAKIDDVMVEDATDTIIEHQTENKHLDEGKIIALLKAGWNFKDIAYDCHCEIDDVKGIAEKYRKQR